MGRDVVVVLGGATVSGNTLLGVNQFGPNAARSNLRYLPARTHSPGERVTHPRATLGEVRQTAAVLGVQPAGAWGLSHGCNRHHVAVGLANWQSRLSEPSDGLVGPDLVRLALERSHSAAQALDTVTDLIERYGQTGPDGDHVFLLADPNEAFVVEAAGRHWALLECQQTRAASDTGLIRQDWRRLSRGLAELIRARGWGDNEGNKLDFQASLADPGAFPRVGLRRWSRATLALAQQEGALDPHCLRRLLLDHFDLCQELTPRPLSWHGSWLASLGGDNAPLVWIAPGNLKAALFFPLVVGEALPQAWVEGLPEPGRDHAVTPQALDQLQAQLDQDAEAFLRLDLPSDELSRRAQEMMTRHAELWLSHTRGFGPAVPTSSAPRSDDLLAFVTE